MGNIVPSSSANQLIFPYSYSTYTYDTSFYNPMMTGNRMSHQEVNETVQAVEAATSTYWRKARCAAWVYLIVVLIWVALFIGLMVPGDFYFGVGWIIYFVVLCVFAVVYSVYARSQREQAVTQAQAVIARYNQTSLAKGLRWNIPIFYRRWVSYIELNMDYQAQPQGVYVPPPTNQQYDNAGQNQNPQYAQNYYGGNQGGNQGYNPQQQYPQGGYPQGGYNPQQNYV